MSRYFAETDSNGVVMRVIVAENIEWCQKYLGGKWVETFMDAKDMHNYAGIGYSYSDEKKNFIPRQVFKSWVLNSKCQWEAPVAAPIRDPYAVWDETKAKWTEPVTVSTQADTI